MPRQTHCACEYILIAHVGISTNWGSGRRRYNKHWTCDNVYWKRPRYMYLGMCGNTVNIFQLMYLSHCLESSRCANADLSWDVGVTLACDDFFAVLYRNHIWTRARTNITISTQHDEQKHVNLQLSIAKVASFWGTSFPKTSALNTSGFHQSRAAPSYF